MFFNCNNNNNNDSNHRKNNNDNSNYLLKNLKNTASVYFRSVDINTFSILPLQSYAN